MKFFALDVETANADYSSICQIGLVEFQNGQITDKWSTLINPEAYFDPFNISIHHITEEDIKNAPTFDRIYDELSSKISGQITVHHMPFDKIAITRACLEYNLDILTPDWLDSAKIARRTWEQFAYGGYGLANLAEFLKIDFKHHDALEDAITAAKIVHFACEKTQLTVEDWINKIQQPILVSYGGSTKIKLEGNSEGPLYGETLVFTGTLSLTRKEAAKIASDLGCNVDDSVTSKTTILVVGTQDSTKLGGYEKSSKHRKTEGLIQKGIPIKILTEKDFVQMCNSEDSSLNLKVSQPDIKKPIKNQAESEKKPFKNSLSIEFKIDDVTLSRITEDFKKRWNNLTIEQKELIQKKDLEHKQLIDSINKCNREQQRQLANDFKTSLENLKQHYNEFQIKSFEKDDLEIIFTIDNEISNLTESLYDLMKNKVALGSYYEMLCDSIESISDELNEHSIPKQVDNYSRLILSELTTISNKILSQSR